MLLYFYIFIFAAYLGMDYYNVCRLGGSTGKVPPRPDQGGSLNFPNVLPTSAFHWVPEGNLAGFVGVRF